MEKYNIIFGGFANNFILCKEIIEFTKNYPDSIIEQATIGAIFDNFSPCTWNGGGHIIDKVFSRHEMMTISNYFGNEGIPIRLTMTNPLLSKEDMYDRYANAILETLYSPYNEVLVSSPIAEEYIRSTYPDYKICRSIIATESNFYDLDDRYFMTVANKKCNNDFNLLKTIPEDSRGKMEFLCNESCIDDCPRGYSHYIVHAKEQLTFNPYSHGRNSFCTMREDCPLSHTLLTKRRSYITQESIVNDYLPLGYKNFKLSGRFSPPTIIEYVAEYLIKPEYRIDFRMQMWNCIYERSDRKI